MPLGRGSLSSSTIRPTRSFKLADASFFGKLATKLDDYDDLPTLAEQQDEQEEVVVTGDSLLDLPEGLWPGRALAELAEVTEEPNAASWEGTPPLTWRLGKGIADGVFDVFPSEVRIIGCP